MQTREQLTAEIDRLIKSYDARRRPQFEKNLSGNDGGAGKLELARSIQPMQFKKGSILVQFADANSDFGAVTPIDLAAAGPGSPDAWRHIMQSQYPTIPAMAEVARPSSEPAPWDPPSSSFEERYSQPVRLDPGPTESIPEALGMEMKVLLGTLVKVKSPGLKAVCDSCKAFGDLMGDVHKAHHDNVAAINKAHSAAMDGVHSVAGARALNKSHMEHMAGVHAAHFDTVSRMHQRFGKAITDALAKVMRLRK
jgi:hypothetical protein